MSGWRNEFFQAARDGNIDVLARYLDQGHDPDGKVDDGTDEFGKTALMYASGKGHAPAVRLLLERGADPNLPLISRHGNSTWDGRTALLAASEGGHAEVVAFLLKAGAKPTPDRYMGKRVESALMSALRHFRPGMESTIATLLDAAGLEVGCVSAAAATGNIELVDSLLGRGANVNEVTPGATPLLEAIDWYKFEMVRFLLEKGANPNVEAEQTTTGRGGNPVIRAVRLHKLELVRVLVEFGAEVNPPGALWMAAIQGHLEIARFLLEHGADVNATNRWDRETPLICAARSGHSKLVRLFLDHGANPSAATEFGDTALDHAVEGHHDEDIALITGAIKAARRQRFLGWLGFGRKRPDRARAKPE